MDGVKRSRKSKMKKRPDDWEHLKQEIAEELGLMDQVTSQGWSGLSAEDSGRLGGVFSARKKALHNAASQLAEANLPGAAPSIAEVVQSEVFPPQKG